MITTLVLISLLAVSGAQTQDFERTSRRPVQKAPWPEEKEW